MAYNWPSSHKAGTTSTDAATDRIDQARADINQNIVNVNEIIDMFDLASEPTNGQILKYNTTTDRFEVGADAGGIALTDLSVSTTSASGGGGLSYDNSTGIFTFTPAVVSTAFDGTSNLVVSDGISLFTPDSTAGITFYTTGATFGAGVDYLSVGRIEQAGDIVPLNNGGINLGSSSKRFDIFAADLNVNGTITGIELNDLSDVDTTGVANNKILKYNSTTSKFEIADETGGTSTVGTHEIWIPAIQMYKAQGNSPCGDLETIVAGTGVTKNFFPFDPNTEENAQFVIAMPKKWNEGAIKFRAYWITHPGVAASGGVTWELGIEVKADDSGFSASFIKGTVDDTYTNSQELMITPQSSNITPAGSPQPDELAVFNIARKVSDANDTFGYDAQLLGVKIYFTTEAETDD